MVADRLTRWDRVIAHDLRCCRALIKELSLFDNPAIPKGRELPGADASGCVPLRSLDGPFQCTSEIVI